MAADTDDPRRTRQFFAAQVGLGRAVVWSSCASALVSSVAALFFGYVALQEVRNSESRTERYVIYLDDQALPVAQARVANDWSPEDGTFVDFASRWVRYLRSRPLDIEALKFQRKEVIVATERRVWQQLQEAMQAADDQVREAAIDVKAIAANLVERQGDDAATILVRWTEQVRQPGAKEATWTATLQVAHVPPKVKREFERNPLGLFVTSFQITQEAS